jgi:hypothetical protein
MSPFSDLEGRCSQMVRTPDRTSADDEHTNVVIMAFTCRNADSPQSGRVTTRRPQPRMCGGWPVGLATE